MTPTEAAAALSYLVRCFGGFAIPDDEKRAFMRLFARLDALAVRDAIDYLVEHADRRPSPNEVAAVVRKRRPAVRDTRPADPWPDNSHAPEHIAELRALITRKVKA